MRRTPDSGLFKKSNASSLRQMPDTALRYNQNQDRWQAFSESVKAQLLEQLAKFPQNIDEIDNCPQFPSAYKDSELFKTQLMNAYAFLAVKRQEIAAELGHGKND